MKDICNIVWPISNTSVVRVLCGQDELRQLLGIDPMQLPNDTQSRQDPPAIAHILQLLWSPIQTSVGQLTFGQPSSYSVRIDPVQSFEDGERSNADPCLSGVTFRTRTCTESSIWVVTFQYVVDDELPIELLESGKVR